MTKSLDAKQYALNLAANRMENEASLLFAIATHVSAVGLDKLAQQINESATSLKTGAMEIRRG